MEKCFVIVFVFSTLHLTICQGCTLPQELWGNWTTTNLGVMVITGSSPSLSFSKLFTGQTVSRNELECKFQSGTQYILEANVPVYTFSQTSPLYMWMCIDFRRSSAYSYYYYLNSEIEIGFDGYRLVGKPSNTSINDVCTTIPSVSEFNVMIKQGHETDAVDAVQCADPLLGSFSFTYTDSSGTFCKNTSSYINSCDEWKRTHISVNNSGCSSVYPFYSSGGQVGCIANVYNTNSGVYYVSLYNLDTSPTTTFVCLAVTTDSNGTVYLSMKQTVCDATQSPTALPTGGATMVLSPNYTCVPVTTTSTGNGRWLPLIISLPVAGLLIIFITVIVCLFQYLKRKTKRKARTKDALKNGDHPMGEMSLALDAPATMDRDHSYRDTKRDLLKRHRGRINTAFNSSAPSVKQKNVKSPSMVKTWKTKNQQFLTAKLVAKGIKAQPSLHGKVPKSFAMSTMSSRMKKRNGIYPGYVSEADNISVHRFESVKTFGTHTASRAGSAKAPKLCSRPASQAVYRTASRTGSRMGSATGSRRGSIDNLAMTRHSKLLRSNSVVHAPAREVPVNRPDINTMQEEYVPEPDVNEVVPSRGAPFNKRSLRDTYL